MINKKILLGLFLVFIFSVLYSLDSGDSIEFLVQQGHSSLVNSVAYSPDGKIIASGSKDNTIKLWEAGTGRLLLTMEGHSTIVFTVAYSPDGKTIISGSSDKTIKIWETGTGKLLRTLESHSNRVNSVAYSPDGKTIVSGSFDETIKIWEAGTGKLLRTFEGHSFSVNSVAYSPDGKTIASGSSDKTVKLWDAGTGRLLRTLEGHSASVGSVAYSPDGKTIASGSSDKTVKLWDAGTGRLLCTFEGHSSIVNSVSYSPDGKTIVSGSSDNTIKIWETGTGKLLRTLIGHSYSVLSVSYSPDGSTIASSGWRSIKVWEAGTGKLLLTLEGHSSSVLSVSYSPDGKTIASGSSDNTIKTWDSWTGKLLHTIKGHSAFVYSVVYSPDGKTIVSCSFDKTIKLWDSKTGGLIRTLDDDVRSVAYSSDGKTIASGNNDIRIHTLEGSITSITMEGSIKIWDSSTGKLLRTFDGHSSIVNSVAYSPDGKTIASGSVDNTIKLWDASTGRLLHTMEGHESLVNLVTYISDGKTIASGSDDKTIKLWDAGTGSLLRTLEGHSASVGSVAFSPDGKTIVSGSDDKTIKLWDAGTGKLLRTLIGHLSPVKSVSYSPDGKIIVSGSWDTSIKYWDSTNGRLLATSFCFEIKGIFGPANNYNYLTFTPNGYYVCSKNGDQYASWIINNQVFTVEQYSEVFNKPDMVIRALKGEILPAPALWIAPEIEWVNRFGEAMNNAVEIVISFQGISPMDEIVFLHNSKPLDIELDEKTKEQKEIKIKLSLEEERNTIVARAWDENRIKTKWLTEEFVYPLGRKGDRPTPEPEEKRLGVYGNKYAIVIGISDYKNLKTRKETPEGGLADLDYAHLDALAFKEFLEDEKVSGGNWTIDYLVQTDATSSNIDNKLSYRLSQARENDLVFIFFSGHARKHPHTPKDLYLLSSDFEVDNYRSGFSYSTLLDLIDNCRTTHIITFIDACHSGTIGFGKGEDAAGFDALMERVAMMTENKVIFASSKGSQESYEHKKLKMGVFSYFLLQGLQGKAQDKNKNRIVDLRELIDYVTEKVQEYTKKTMNVPVQIPDSYEAKGCLLDDFPVALRE